MKHPVSRIGLFVIGCIAAACARRAPPLSMRSIGPEATDGLTRLRAATQSYRTLDSAVATGYPRTVTACLVHEHHGAMGYHHVNPRHVDATLDVERPEILLYERRPDGEYRLNGVEFILPYQFWPRDSAAPALMGQRLKREDNLKFWYLHVWAWSENADGVFADFNPAVACSASERKIFRPSTEPPPESNQHEHERQSPASQRSGRAPAPVPATIELNKKGLAPAPVLTLHAVTLDSGTRAQAD